MHGQGRTSFTARSPPIVACEGGHTHDPRHGARADVPAIAEIIVRSFSPARLLRGLLLRSFLPLLTDVVSTHVLRQIWFYVHIERMVISILGTLTEAILEIRDTPGTSKRNIIDNSWMLYFNFKRYLDTWQ